jgi:hypothetical protein
VNCCSFYKGNPHSRKHAQHTEHTQLLRVHQNCCQTAGTVSRHAVPAKGKRHPTSTNAHLPPCMHGSRHTLLTAVTSVCNPKLRRLCPLFTSKSRCASWFFAIEHVAAVGDMKQRTGGTLHRQRQALDRSLLSCHRLPAAHFGSHPFADKTRPHRSLQRSAAQRSAAQRSAASEKPTTHPLEQAALRLAALMATVPRRRPVVDHIMVASLHRGQTPPDTWSSFEVDITSTKGSAVDAALGI